MSSEIISESVPVILNQTKFTSHWGVLEVTLLYIPNSDVFPFTLCY